MAKTKVGIKTLAKELQRVWLDLRKGHIEIPRAKELANCAGKIISAKKVQLEYKCVKDKDPKYYDAYLEDEEEV